MGNSNNIEDIERLIYAIAHDLKSPVTNMKNLFSLLNRTESQESRDRILNKIQSSAYQLDEILNGLMEMVDIDNHENLSHEVIDFQKTWELVTAEISESFLEKNPKVEIDFSTAPTINYPKGYLRSIFLNLLTNSLKYSHESRRVEISIVSKIHQDYTIVEFKDNGQGIDLDTHGGDLFKPFKRFTNKGSGKGIGLNLVYQMLTKLGGKIEVESEVGKGTCFRLYFKSKLI